MEVAREGGEAAVVRLELEGGVLARVHKVRLVGVVGLVARGREVRDAPAHHDVDGLGDHAVLEERLAEVEHVVDDDVRPRVGEVDDALRERGLPSERRVEREGGPRRDVVGQLHHGPALVAARGSGQLLHHECAALREVAAGDVLRRPRDAVVVEVGIGGPSAAVVVGVGEHADADARPVHTVERAGLVGTEGPAGLAGHFSHADHRSGCPDASDARSKRHRIGHRRGPERAQPRHLVERRHREPPVHQHAERDAAFEPERLQLRQQRAPVPVCRRRLDGDRLAHEYARLGAHLEGSGCPRLGVELERAVDPLEVGGQLGEGAALERRGLRRRAGLCRKRQRERDRKGEGEGKNRTHGGGEGSGLSAKRLKAQGMRGPPSHSGRGCAPSGTIGGR